MSGAGEFLSPEEVEQFDRIEGEEGIVFVWFVVDPEADHSGE